MLKNELEALKQTELRCREILNQANAERLEIEEAAKKEAEKEYNRRVKEAHREGEARLEQTRADALAQKSARQSELETEIECMRLKSQERIQFTVQKMMERMCGNE